MSHCYTDSEGVVRCDTGEGTFHPAAVSWAVGSALADALEDAEAAPGVRYRMDIEVNVGVEDGDVLVHSITAV